MDKFMKRAMELAGKANPFPNPPVGAVVVKGGRIIGEGFHRKAGMNHAEIEAFEDVKASTGSYSALRGSTLYVTLEPCSHTLKRTPPCTDAIIRHGIAKVVYGMPDPNPLVSGIALLKKAGVKVKGPVAEKEALELKKEYVAGMARKPLIVIKMAMSADGKTATRSGDSKWISCPEEREFVHQLRAEFDAVMVGAGTVKADDPVLTTHGLVPARNPLRIIIDGRLSIPLSSGLLHNKDGKTIVVASEAAPKAKVERMAAETEATVFVCGKKKVDLSFLVDMLRGMNVKSILIEGGSELNASAIEAGIADRLITIIAPIAIGGHAAKGVIGGRGVEKVADARKLRVVRMKKIGTDLLIEYEFIR